MSTLESPSGKGPLAPGARARELALALVEGVAFWAAVLLPFCTLALLAVRSAPATVVPVAPSWSLLTGVLVANLVALLIGHRHGRSVGQENSETMPASPD